MASSSPRIDELRKKFDENPRRYFAPLANEYRKSGDLEQAIFICQEYLPQQPGHMSGHIVYGQALFELGRNEEAQIVFETALSLDPENLIALRHLGDIARQMGDSNAARIWYQRVLEADPRNEEIAQIMISLLEAPESQPPTPSDAAARTPLSAPAVADASAGASGNQDSGGSLLVEKSEDATQMRAPEPVLAPEPPPPAHTTSATTAGDGKEFLSLDDFNLGGAPVSPAEESWTEAGAPEAYVVDSAAAASAEPMALEDFEELSPEQPAAESEPEEEGVFKLGQEEGPFWADPLSIAAGSATPIPLELEAEPEAAPEPLLAPESAPAFESFSELPHDEPFADAPIETEGPALDGLETFEPGIINAAPVEPVALETDAFFDPTPAPPQVFVTETMAELYLQQGHLDSALDIYRQLVEQRPGDEQLYERFRAVEDRVHGAAVESFAEPEPAQSVVYGGPTIREFLAGLVSGRAPYAVDVVPEPEPATEFFVDDPPQSFAEEPANEPANEPAGEPAYETTHTPEFDDERGFAASESRSTPSASDSVTESIGALFSGADASEDDTTAASNLQEAFAPDSPENAPLQGMPAHRASSELSLDHVFKGNSPPPADSDGFSFDQFFADDMADAPPTAAGEAGASPSEPTDDIAQFNAWLNGLKKT